MRVTNDDAPAAEELRELVSVHIAQLRVFQRSLTNALKRMSSEGPTDWKQLEASLRMVGQQIEFLRELEQAPEAAELPPSAAAPPPDAPLRELRIRG